MDEFRPIDFQNRIFGEETLLIGVKLEFREVLVNGFARANYVGKNREIVSRRG